LSIRAAANKHKSAKRKKKSAQLFQIKNTVKTQSIRAQDSVLYLKVSGKYKN
jgi:hypothetical protein